MAQLQDKSKKSSDADQRMAENHQPYSTRDVHPLLRLQRDAGNRAVVGLLESQGWLQTKPRSDRTADVPEHEADLSPAQALNSTLAPAPMVQRKCAACTPTSTCAECEEEQGRVQRKPKDPVAGVQLKSVLVSSPPLIQRAARNGDSATTSSNVPETTPEPPTATAGPLLIDDEVATVAPGQMRKTEFLEQLRSTVCTTADEALAEAGQTTQGCPYIEKWLGYYEDQPPSHIEGALRKYAPEAATATSAGEYIPIVSNRVRRAVQTWARTGEITGVPDELKDMISGPGAALGAIGGMLGGIGSAIGGAFSAAAGAIGGAVSAAAGAIGGAVSSIGKALFKGKAGHAQANEDPQAIRSQLNDGQPLSAETGARMSTAFGHEFSSVRVHTDASAAGLSDQLNARAFTVGSDIAFGAGEYQPGTLIGDALIAHELAHVVQQRGAGSEVGAKSDSQTDNETLEDAADESAVGAIGSLWGDRIPALRQVGGQSMPRVKSGLRLQQCGSCGSSKAKATDQRRGTKLPDATTQTGIRGQLHPTSTGGGGVSLAWDGASVGGVVGAVEAAKRTALQTSLTAALNAHLTAAMTDVNAVALLRRLPMTEFEGAGKAAQQVTDERFSSWMAVAAMTPTQQTFHRDFVFQGSGAGQNLFDAFDPAQRAATGHAIDPDDLASWIAETDSGAQAAAAPHNFDPNRGGEEHTFLVNDVLNPFVAANRADLEKYDTFGFAISGEQIVAPSSVAGGGLSDTAPGGGVPSDAERAAKWAEWRLLVHEYIHTLAHPAFNSASRGNRIMTEGFCEMFTKEVVVPAQKKAPGDAAIRQLIEGGDFGKPKKKIVGEYSAGSYADYLARAENIRDAQIGGRGGDNAVKSAFFQGHVEFLGLKPDGTEATPIAAGAGDLITVPAGTATIADLAVLSKVKATVIASKNAGVPEAGPLPAEMHVPDARDHIVVEASDTGGTKTTETKAQIAAQNGISETDLENANPSVAWAALTVGQRILIPKH
jgi:hypothetical protein